MNKIQIEKLKTHGKKRSDKWPKVRKAHIKNHPACEVCGDKKSPQVHHVRPFHLHPELELEDSNLITLCEGEERNCHRLFGHLENWKSVNKDVRRDAKIWSSKIKKRP